jgi:hypothetical protein
MPRSRKPCQPHGLGSSRRGGYRRANRSNWLDESAATATNRRGQGGPPALQARMAPNKLLQPPRRMSAFRGKADASSCSRTCPLMTQSRHPVVANGGPVGLAASSQCLTEAGRVYGVRTKPELMRRRWKARISLRGSQPEYRPAHTIISRLRSRCAAESGSPEASSITVPR